MRSANSDLLPPALVATAWLAERLDRPEVRPLDASWYLPSTGRDARAEFEAGHIPGADFFDLDAVSDPESPLPHTMPSAASFQESMRALGLHDGDVIVVYDGSGANMSAGRAWWMLRTFGHRAVAILDGGLELWRREGRPLEQGPVERRRGDFTSRPDASKLASVAAVQSAGARGIQVVDARSAGRFAGTAPEPRPGLRGGHVPGSRNVPYTELIRSDGTMRSPSELEALFRAAGVSLDRPVITTCGSGVTACALLHALHLIGHEDSALYDGSWTEWGARPDLPIEQGPAGPA